VAAPAAGWRNAAAYLRDPLPYLEGVARTGAPVARVPFPGGHSFHFVSDPDLIRRALVDEHASFVKGRALRASRRLLGDGLLTSEGADHLRRRRMIQPVFRRAVIETYGAEMVAAAERTSARWRDGMELDVDVAMTDLALDIVGRTIFNADVESEASEIRDVLEAGMRVFHRFLLPGGELLWHLPLPATRGFNSARDDFDRMMLALIRSRDRAVQDPPDLIDHLISLDDEGGSGRLSETEIRDEAVTLLLAGHETTARALTWAWHLLTLYPDAATRLRGELGEVLGGRSPTAADYARLPYTRAVFCESLRLYPPVWALARIAVREVHLGHLVVPDGGTVIMSQWVTQRNPELFEHALAFRPERWLSGAEPHPGAYFPFGGGPRLCIGERFAMLEGVLVLATLAQRWQVEAQHTAPRIDARFTLRPRGGLRVLIRAAADCWRRVPAITEASP
jgi:cytochrome P450